MNKDTLPLVSICIPTHNSGETLGETMSSIIGQSYPRLEILVVDNDSTDNTIEVAQCFKDTRVTIHVNPQNIGAEGNFNRCIELANGAYTAIYHADDLYTARMVAEQVEFLERHPEAGGVLTEAVVIDERGRENGTISFPLELRKRGSMGVDLPELFIALLRHSNFLICPSAMVRSAVYKNDIKGWRDELFGSSADLDVWLRIARSFRLGLLPEKLMKYRVSDIQYSAKVRYQTEPADFFRVIDHYLAQDDIRAVVTTADLDNYQKLVRRDIVMRAANLFLKGDFSEAALLLNGFFNHDMLVDSIRDKRSLSVLLLSSYLKMTNVPGLRSCGQAPLGRLKRVLRK
jgi:glycosyltransferase involved in cell wall biosynthesis